ncbi:MAG: zinc metallopeptidase [Sphaerospermopsis sp. SIO1G2]|nr:zinc metallopeptidase [Sphaerospermopsis sp. SIO1G2]
MFFDPLYLLILAASAIISFGASAWTKSAFHKAKQVATERGWTGAEVAMAILREQQIYDVSVVEVQGFLSDHYNPINKQLALSPDVFHGRSAASAGIAAHEVGHAIQHAHGYFPLQLRSLLVPAAQFGSTLGPWIVIAGMFMGAAEGMAGGQTVATIGVVLFAASTLFTLVTLPVEFDASSRAKAILAEMGIIRPGQEHGAMAGVLNAAAMTYVAAAASSLMMLLYWAYKAGLIGGRR